ncbi:MAG TPA: hypothetical protein GX499_02525 [Clostridiales bacterium]|mgnify:CR=1 FL=1|nr:hypothetical protein [Clostridiales bacterium]
MKKFFLFACCVAICLAGFLTNVTASVGDASEAAEKPSEAASQYDMDALEAKVEDLVKRVEAAKPTGTAEEMRNQFFALHQEIETVDNEIDALDDKIGSDFMSGKLSWKDYFALERKLDRLEKRLDRAEDRLERTFHMDD